MGIVKIVTAEGQVSIKIKSSNRILLTWLFVISRDVKGKPGQKADQNTGGRGTGGLSERKKQAHSSDSTKIHSVLMICKSCLYSFSSYFPWEDWGSLMWVSYISQGPGNILDVLNRGNLVQGIVLLHRMAELRSLKWDSVASLRLLRAGSSYHCLKLKGQQAVAGTTAGLAASTGSVEETATAMDNAWSQKRRGEIPWLLPVPASTLPFQAFTLPSAPPVGWTDVKTRGQRQLGKEILCDREQGRAGQGNGSKNKTGQD